MNKPVLIGTLVSSLLALYYLLKPAMPLRLRYWLRRCLARRTLALTSDWPIKPGSEAPPRNWPGWPGGKQFAFILTHDVEGQRGLERCQMLMEMEERSGFRSSFNFIPEGAYQVSPEFRALLGRRGFEVGIHDLHHDGTLFGSREEFKRQAQRINHYLAEWGVSGFRAGFMFHNLDWQRKLRIYYDASTFDVDPFEPQPDGVHTIFPFWVEGDDQETEGYIKLSQTEEITNGYVELPYTLVQDSTLFLLLRQRTIDLWKRKLDWVAQHGGMVLLNTHPDYMAFDRTESTWNEYPAKRYRELLEYVRTQYADRYWAALPREVATYCAPFKPPAPTPAPKRVCMITHSFYESDNRVIRYAEALAQRGDQVEVFALRRQPNQPREEVISGVRVFRVQDRFGKHERSKFSYLYPLLRFLVVSSWRVSRRHWHAPYQLVHAHNIPDFVVFAAWLPKLSGARIVLDVHDIVPEFFSSKFHMPETSLLVRGLQWAERISAAFADHVILANHLWLDRYAARSASRDKCSVFINNVDSSVFKPVAYATSKERKIIVFPGGLQWHQGLDIALRAFEKLRHRLPQCEFHIYGDGNMKPELQQLAAELGLNGSVRFHDPLPVRQIAAVMAQADLGVVPKRADSFGNEAYSTKIMEFMSVGVPAVISSTKIDRFYFDDSVVRFFESGNVEQMAEAMHEVLTQQPVRQEMIARAAAYAKKNSWERHRHDYLMLVDSLFIRR
jgi:glycosyltransferase involved in cell wall biosynthesis